MSGITWTDVRLKPQQYLAEDADSGGRRVQARLVINRHAERPYYVEFTLWDDTGTKVDVWSRAYRASNMSDAFKAYFDWRSRATLWLRRASLSSVRPRNQDR